MGPFESVLDVDGNVTISRASKSCGGFGKGSEQERCYWVESRSKEGDEFGKSPLLVLQGAQDRVRPDWVSPLYFSFLNSFSSDY